ncbi:MAG: PocR ligand-binding domain-containing protein [Spirochaetales bacterium]|nr:PocR ligand-binding domain-containing protein [Spirochaetales bacterium]
MARLSIDDLKDLRILEQLCEIYYQNTGMVVSIHHPGRNGRVDFYPQEQRSDFCRLVQSTPGGRQLCLTCDREGLEAARRKGSYHIYRCHAGLVDVAIPLDYKGTEIGSIYTGQVLLEVPTRRRFRQVYRQLASLGLEAESLEPAFLQVKVVERSRLVFFAKLLHLLGNYIIMAENELHLQKTIALQDRELHRRELEKIHLEKTLQELTISVLESGGPGEDDRRPTGTGNGSYVVSKAQLFIRANYGKDIRLEDVARAVYLSPNYFSSLFKRVTGTSFRSYLVRKRVEAAQELLAESELPIKEIVTRTGFKDYNYFNRTFASLSGFTPGRYRELHRAGGTGPARAELGGAPQDPGERREDSRRGA